MIINPDSMVAHNHVVVLNFSSENIPKEKEFWVELVYGRGFVKFRQQESNLTNFVAVEVAEGCFPHLYPIASLQGVLWRRQAAIEADRGISSYLAGESQKS